MGMGMAMGIDLGHGHSNCNGIDGNSIARTFFHGFKYWVIFS